MPIAAANKSVPANATVDAWSGLVGTLAFEAWFVSIIFHPQYFHSNAKTGLI
jgi:hypothetical protein